MDTIRDNSEHYNSEYYQRTVRLERGYYLGMATDEVYQRETDFALRVANMKFQKGDRILDLASGAGNHIACFDKRLEGKVPIDGIEKADKLAAIANNVVLAKEPGIV